MSFSAAVPVRCPSQPALPCHFFFPSPSLHDQGPNQPLHATCLCSFCKPARFLFKQLCRIKSFKLFSRSLSALSSVLRPGCPLRASLRAPRCMRAGLPPACFLLQGCSWWGRGKEAAPSLPPFLPSSAAVPPAPLCRLAPAVAVRFLPVLAGHMVPRGRARRAAGLTALHKSHFSSFIFFLLYFFPPFSARRCVRRSRCPPGSSH